MQEQQQPKRPLLFDFVPRVSMVSRILAAIMALLSVVIVLATTSAFSAEPGRETLSGHVPPVVTGLTPKGRLSATNQLYLAIGLPLRNQAALDELLRQLYDPHSASYRKFLTPREFTARFGPTE